MKVSYPKHTIIEWSSHGDILIVSLFFPSPLCSMSKGNMDMFRSIIDIPCSWSMQQLQSHGSFSPIELYHYDLSFLVELNTWKALFYSIIYLCKSNILHTMYILFIWYTSKWSVNSEGKIFLMLYIKLKNSQTSGTTSQHYNKNDHIIPLYTPHAPG